MNQDERRQFLIQKLLDERPEYRNIAIPPDQEEQKRLLRSLFKIRMPGPAGPELLKVQDKYLQQETRQKGITELSGGRLFGREYICGRVILPRCSAMPLSMPPIQV